MYISLALFFPAFHAMNAALLVIGRAHFTGNIIYGFKEIRA